MGASKGILIAGNESTLSAVIATEAGKQVGRFATALIPNRLPYPLENFQLGDRPSALPKGKGAVPLAWNPGSPVSARTLVLSVENQIGQIDEAILVCAPPAVRKKAEDLNPSNIEIIVNDHIKGWFFLVKELAVVFKARQGGALALVLSDIVSGGGHDDTDLIGPSVAASFRSFAQGLMASSQTEPYGVYGFSIPAGTYFGTGDDHDVGTFVFKILDDSKRNAGKWHKFGGKLTFLKH
jgi:NAD(P)-dependent dehydrogenase (short-subunit alcohol dehydrogenase family)